MKLFLRSLLKIFSWIIISALNSSCDPILNQGFDVTFSTKSVTLIDSSTYSCQALNTGGTSADVGAIYFQLPQVTINWLKTQTLTVHWINLKLRSGSLSGGKYDCMISGDSLLYTWYSSSGASYTSVTMTNSSSSALRSNSCPIKCGGVSFTDKTHDVYGTGTVYIYGTYDENGTTKPVTSESYIDFYYKSSGN